MPKIEGVFPVVPTPLNPEGGLDEQGYRHLVSTLTNAGVHGVTSLGSNGECVYLTPAERRRAMEVASEARTRGAKLIVGAGCFGTDEAVEVCRHAREVGADAAMVALPLYYPLDLDAVRRHYGEVGRRGELPILYYNVPDLTHLKLAPAQVAEVLRVPGVAGAKESILNVREIEELIRLAPDRSILTGSCMTLQETLKAGGAGVICPIPCLDPKLVLGYYGALKAGTADEARALRNRVFQLMPLMAMSRSPQALLKEALRLLGHPVTSRVKEPLPQLQPGESEKVRAVLRKLGYLGG